MTTSVPETLLCDWLSRDLPDDAWSWLRTELTALRTEGGARRLYLTVSLVTRRIGKADLSLLAADLERAEAARPGWKPQGWSTDQAARIALLLASAHAPGDFSANLQQLAATSDVGELIAFYRGLPLYPEPEAHAAWAARGLRTNIKAVFDAIALGNPYPSEQFDEGVWNHMVLKAVFIGSPLDPIIGLDARRNGELRRMLCDYAHERWAASRPVTPELWRCVGSCADPAAVADLCRVVEQGDDIERRAAVLALRERPDGPELPAACANRIAQQDIETSWQDIYDLHTSRGDAS